MHVVAGVCGEVRPGHVRVPGAGEGDSQLVLVRWSSQVTSFPRQHEVQPSVHPVPEEDVLDCAAGSLVGLHEANLLHGSRALVRPPTGGEKLESPPE